MVGSGLLYPIGMGYGIAGFKRDSKTAAGVFTFIRTVLCTIGLIILAAFFSENPLSPELRLRRDKESSESLTERHL